MRAREFLIEYNRQKTADQVGARIIMALIKDRSAEISHYLDSVRRKMNGLSNSSIEQLNAVMKPNVQTDLINAILAEIETKDPSPNKGYVPWLAKMYAKGDVKLEDLNRGDLLRYYDVGKKRRMIKPEHADINRFKSYKDFANVMLTGPYDLNAIIPSEEQSDSGKAIKAYSDENVTIIIPEDEAAACKYGRNTRWCTASTKGHNMFDNYNRTGKLYILIPKQPKYDGEKYQLHFSSSSYMDENDDPVPLSDVLNRFPGTKEFFLQAAPELKEKIEFIPDEELQQAIESIAELVQERVWEEVSDWESRDDGYYQFLKDEGLVDEENGEIDWDKVDQAGLNYSEYNPEVERWSRDIINAATPTPEYLRYVLVDYDYSQYDNIKLLPVFIGTMLREKYRGRRDEGDANIGQWLREKVSMKKEGNMWKPQVDYGLRLPR